MRLLQKVMSNFCFIIHTAGTMRNALNIKKPYMQIVKGPLQSWNIK